MEQGMAEMSESSVITSNNDEDVEKTPKDGGDNCTEKLLSMERIEDSLHPQFETKPFQHSQAVDGSCKESDDISSEMVLICKSYKGATNTEADNLSDERDEEKETCLLEVDGIEIEKDQEVSNPLLDTDLEGEEPEAIEKPKAVPPFPGFGLLLGVISCIFFSFMAVCVKWLEDVHAFEILLFRQLLMTLFIIPVVIYSKQPYFGIKGQRLGLWLRGFFGTTNMCLCYIAYKNIAVGDATVIIMCSPIFVGIISCILLKERFRVFEIITTITAVGGCILIVQPPFMFGQTIIRSEEESRRHLLGALSALGGTLCSAITYVIIRKMSHVHYSTMIFSHGVWGMIQAFVLVIFLRELKDPPTGLPRILMVVIGVFAFLGQLCLTNAFKYENAGPISVTRTSEVVMAFILQFIILGEVPTVFSAAGAVLVSTCVVFTGIKKWVHTAKEKPDAPQNTAMKCLVKFVDM